MCNMQRLWQRLHSTQNLCCNFCFKDAQRKGEIISLATTEEVDQAGVMGFTSYLRTAEEITWG